MWKSAKSWSCVENVGNVWQKFKKRAKVWASIYKQCANSWKLIMCAKAEKVYQKLRKLDKSWESEPKFGKLRQKLMLSKESVFRVVKDF